MDLSPCNELLHDRDQIRNALLTAFDDVIVQTTAAESDEMAARTLLDVVAYVVSFKLSGAMLADPAEITTFARNETLRYEMYLREHLLRRRCESETSMIGDGDEDLGDAIPATIADSDAIPVQPAETNVTA